MPEITLRPATIDDVQTLRRWDMEPHVIAAGIDEDWHWETELRRHPHWREQLIAELDGTPIGFMEIIDPSREESHYWCDIGTGLRAIDMWIGEAHQLNKGYGSNMMQQALRRCFAAPEVEAVVVDPLTANTRAHRFYQRHGFRFVEKRRFGKDDCMVFRISREQWQQHAEYDAH